MNNDLLMQKKAKQSKSCLAWGNFIQIDDLEEVFDGLSGLSQSISKKVKGVAKIHQLTKPIEKPYFLMRINPLKANNRKAAIFNNE